MTSGFLLIHSASVGVCSKSNAARQPGQLAHSCVEGFVSCGPPHRRSEHALQDVSDAEMDDDEAALAAADSWEPDPVTADPQRSSRTRRMSDIIAALVGIYGSKELFITEYRCALCRSPTQLPRPAPSFPTWA